MKTKRFILGTLLAIGFLAGYLIWLELRPVNIVAVHQSDHYSYALVKNFPITDGGKIT